MAKYEVKDINKNGVEDAWEIAKYAKANAAAEESPTKMIGGIAGAMAQQTGAMTGVLGGTTNLGVQTQQGAASVAPQQPPSVFNNNENLVGQKMFGQNVPGQYDKIISPLGKKGPIKEGLKALAYAATGGLAPIVQAAEKLLGNKNKTTSPSPTPPPKEKTREGHSSVKSLTAQRQYNDQLRKQQADNSPKKAYTKTSRKIEKVPQFSFTAVKKDLPRIDAIPQDQKNKS